MNKLKQIYNDNPERFYLVTLFVLGLILLFAGLWCYPLIDVDETRYAVMARSLIGHDWNLLSLNGVPFIEKPPMLFWITAISIKLFGFNTLAIRLPIAFLATITVFFIYLTGKFIKNAKFGFYSALVLLSSAMFIMLAHVAIIDMVFTAFITWTIYCGLLTDFIKDKRKYLLSVGFWVSLSLAFLSKGILAIVIPFGILGLHRILRRDFKGIFTPFNIIVGSLIFLGINAPWHLYMYKTYNTLVPIHLGSHTFMCNEFFYTYIILHHFERLVNADNLGKVRPLWYFIPVFIVGFLPWTYGFVESIKNIFKRKLFNDDYIRFFLIYFVLIFSLFSVASGKLMPYILPSIPAAAFLTAYWAENRSIKTIGACVSLSIIFKFIFIIVLATAVYHGGMNELVEMSTMAQHQNYHLITFDTSIKPSLFINYKKDLADIIIENEPDKLKTALKNNPKSFVIVRNKNFQKGDYQNYFKTNLVLVKTYKKYSLYSTK